MVSKDPTPEDKLQEKIGYLTGLLEQELINLKSTHCKKLSQIKNTYVEGIEILNANFEKQWDDFNALHLRRMLACEEQVTYLKELQQSQRLMLEDNLVYIRQLEERLKQQP
ncbi:MAG TPA: hypothetical protein PLJ60_14060 [Chryseolinea sp.]|nr:hypothetical protein [Chryseolinea sp.]HPM31456.1 hypothetical protein [Chryseolinea sp.]